MMLIVIAITLTILAAMFAKWTFDTHALNFFHEFVSCLIFGFMIGMTVWAIVRAV